MAVRGKRKKKRLSNSDHQRKKPNIDTKQTKDQDNSGIYTDDESNSSEKSSVIGNEEVQSKYRPIPIIINTEGLAHEETMRITNKVKDVAEATQFKFSRNNLTLYTQYKADHGLITRKLKDEHIQFHTFTSKEEKDFKFVIKGLPPTNPEDIKMDLEDKGFAPKKITQMKSSKENFITYPFYFLVMGPETDVAAVYVVKAIGNTRVKIERYRNNKTVTQCYNCQQFGHWFSNCYRNPKCVKWTENHQTRDCPKTKEEEPKCTNCSKNHPANYRGCEVYESYLAALEKRRQKSRPQNAYQTNVATLNRHNFPVLGNATAQEKGLQDTATHLQQPSTSQQPATSHPQTTLTGYSSALTRNSGSTPKDITLISDLMAEIRTLRSLCDIQCVKNAIKALNT